jgi:hypothetical protein
MPFQRQWTEVLQILFESDLNPKSGEYLRLAWSRSPQVLAPSDLGSLPSLATKAASRLFICGPIPDPLPKLVPAAAAAAQVQQQ